MLVVREERRLKKLTRSPTEDIEPLLPVGVRFDEAVATDAFNDVRSTLIARLCGDAWRLTAEVVAQLRSRHPSPTSEHRGGRRSWRFDEPIERVDLFDDG